MAEISLPEAQTQKASIAAGDHKIWMSQCHTEAVVLKFLPEVLIYQGPGELLTKITVNFIYILFWLLLQEPKNPGEQEQLNVCGKRQ